jgi:hypothetical protein
MVYQHRNAASEMYSQRLAHTFACVTMHSIPYKLYAVFKTFFSVLIDLRAKQIGLHAHYIPSEELRPEF